MTEFRKYGRSPLPGKVKLKHREFGEIYAEDGNISATGLFLKIHRPGMIEIGDELAVELPDEEDRERHLETRLRVVRITPDGVGLTFI